MRRDRLDPALRLDKVETCGKSRDAVTVERARLKARGPLERLQWVDRASSRIQSSRVRRNAAIGAAPCDSTALKGLNRCTSGLLIRANYVSCGTSLSCASVGRSTRCPRPQPNQGANGND